MEYLNFDVRIRTEGDGYVATVHGPAGEGVHHFDWPFAPDEVDRYIFDIGRPRHRASRKQGSRDLSPEYAPKSDERTSAKEFGRRLAGAVFDGEVAERLAASRHAIDVEDQGLRIRLQLSDVPELQSVPWEFIWKDDLEGFPVLSRETPVVRYLDRAGSTLQTLVVEPPLRVLLMVSSPVDSSLATLDVQLEQDQMRTALAQLSNDVEITVLEEASLDALQNELRAKQYHVFHYIGHSGFDAETGVGMLALEDANGRLSFARSDQLMVLLKDHPSLRLVVLNSCDGARRVSDDPVAGLAHALVWGGLPAVIAMQFEISDEAAIMFAHELYEALAGGDVVDQALAEARKRIYNSPLTGTEWGTPVLFMRVPDGRLFSIPEKQLAKSENPPVTSRDRLHQGWDRFRSVLVPVGAVLGAIAAGVTIWLFVRGENHPPTISCPIRVDSVAAVPTEVQFSGCVDDLDNDTFSIVPDATSATGGSVVRADDGTVTYTARRDFFGNDQFGYNAVDEHGGTVAGTAFVSVAAGAMNKDLNIAVAELTTVGDAPADTLGRSTTESLLAAVSRGVEGEARLSVDVAGPDRTGEVAGVTFDEQAEAVVEIAERLNAHVVVYGVLSVDGSTTVETRMYLSPSVLGEAIELAGSYSLREASVSSTNPAAVRLELEAIVEPTVRAVADLSRGLAFYQINDYAEAEGALLAAAGSWPVTPGDSNGKEVLLHILGNITGEQGRLDEAADYYQQAIDLGDDDARGRFGLNEVRFMQTRGAKCGASGEPDREALDDVADEFAAIQELPEPQGSFLHARARAEIGRVLLCQSLNGADRIDEARAELHGVIDDYGSVGELADLVAEAHQALGFSYSVTGDHDAAIDEYRAAIEITNEESRRAFFHNTIGGIYECDLADPEQARVEFALADALTTEPLERRECAASGSDD